jgi:opacity protein-like surface antigen
MAPGAFAGGQIGYNYQSGVPVYGVEADFNFAAMEGTSTCSSLSGDFINSNCKVGVNAFGTLTARLGLALGPDGRSLIYGKGGAAWLSADVETFTNDSTTNGTSGAAGNFYGRNSTDLNPWGWTLGAGAEYALTGNWSVKAEYDYANFGKQSVALLPSAVLDSTGAVVDAVPARQGHVSEEMHLFKLGLNYRLGDHAAPIEDSALGSLKDMPATIVSPFGFEIGGRYWYSWGRHKYDLGLGKAIRCRAIRSYRA